MLALLRKEAREALVGLVLLSALLAWIVIRTGASIVVPGNQDHLVAVAIFAVAIGVCHGFGEFAVEERNTWRYLVHRSTGYAGAFAAKLLVDWTVLALLTIIPIGIHAAWIVWFSDDASIALWSRYLEIATTAAIAIGAHAIGVFSAQLRRPTWLRFTISLVATIAFLLASAAVTVAPYGAMLGPAARYLLWIAAIALPLYMLSYRMFVAGNDDDRAFSGVLGVGVTICVLGLLAPSSLYVIGAVQTLPLKGIVDSQPDIWRGTDGKMHLTQTFGMSSQAVTDLLRNSGRVITRAFARTSRATTQADVAQPLLHAATTAFEFGSAWDTIRWRPLGSDEQIQGDVSFPKRGGRLAIVQHFKGKPVRRLLMLGKGLRNDELSSLAVYIEGPDTICLVDPQDCSMWSVVPNAPEPRLERVSLPNDDVFVRVERRRYWIPFEADNRWQIVDVGWLVIGEHGIYQWRGEHFVVGEQPQMGVLASEPTYAPTDLRVDITRPDALEPTVVVRDVKTGATLFEYAYTNPFDWRTAAAYACSLMRPTICGVVSSFHDVPDDVREVHEFIDPLLTGGRRVWLLALNLLLSIALAARACSRGGVGDPRRVFETLAILIVGVPAAVVLALVEPSRRAPRKLIVAPEPREHVLISSI